MIGRAWRETRYFFYIFLFLPAFLSLALFSVWSNILTVDLEQTLGIFDSKETQRKRAIEFTYAILVVCGIILLQELAQMIKNGVRDYFGDVWNIIDLAPSVTAMTLMGFFLYEDSNQTD